MATLSEYTLGVFRDDLYAALRVPIVASGHPHPRARFRDWATKRLQAASDQPFRIEVSRGTPEQLDDLPRLWLYTLEESPPDVLGLGPRELVRSCTMAVHLIVAERELGGLRFDDVLDAFAFAVEILLLNDRDSEGALGRNAKTCDLGTTKIQIPQRGDRQLIQAMLEFTVTYDHEIAVPVDHAFESVGIQWDLAEPRPDGEIEAEDVLRLPVIGDGHAVVSVSAAGTATFGP